MNADLDADSTPSSTPAHRMMCSWRTEEKTTTSSFVTSVFPVANRAPASGRAAAESTFNEPTASKFFQHGVIVRHIVPVDVRGIVEMYRGVASGSRGMKESVQCQKSGNCWCVGEMCSAMSNSRLAGLEAAMRGTSQWWFSKLCAFYRCGIVADSMAVR